jgi:hypothetical protein
MAAAGAAFGAALSEVSSPPPTTVTCRLGVLDEMRTIFGSGQFDADAP